MLESTEKNIALTSNHDKGTQTATKVPTWGLIPERWDEIGALSIRARPPIRASLCPTLKTVTADRLARTGQSDVAAGSAALPRPDPHRERMFRRPLPSRRTGSTPSGSGTPPGGEAGQGSGRLGLTGGGVPRLPPSSISTHSPRAIRMNFIAPRAEPLIREIPAEPARERPRECRARHCRRFAGRRVAQGAAIVRHQPDGEPGHPRGTDPDLDRLQERYAVVAGDRRRNGHAGAGRGQGVRCRPSGPLA